MEDVLAYFSDHFLENFSHRLVLDSIFTGAIFTNKKRYWLNAEPFFLFL